MGCTLGCSYPRCPEEWLPQLHSLWQPELCNTGGRWGVGVMARLAHEFLSGSNKHGGHWGIGVGEERSEHPRCPKLNPCGIRKSWRTEEWTVHLLINSGLFHVNGESMWCQGKLQHSNFISTDISTTDVPKKISKPLWGHTCHISSHPSELQLIQ